jgi:hypothetical protein
MGIVRKTFEAFPTTFGGPSKPLVKAILTRPGDVKTQALLMLSNKSPLLKRTISKGVTEPTFVPELLRTAKAYVDQKPPVEAPQMLIPVVRPPKEFGTIRSFPTCPSARPIWSSGRVPSITQTTVPLRPGLEAAAAAVRVTPAVSQRSVPAPVEKPAIRTRLALGEKLASPIRIGDDYRTSLLIASRLADMFRQPTSVRTVDPTQNADELRDIAKGLAFEQLAAINTDTVNQTLLNERRTRDVALYVLQADYRSEKVQANKLRATERLTIVQDLKQKSDTERDLIQQLLAIGAAPYLLTRSDRALFARQAQELQDANRAEEDEADQGPNDMPPLEEVGVGQPRAGDEDGDDDDQGQEHGDYGDRPPLPEGRDPPETSLGAGGEDDSI